MPAEPAFVKSRSNSDQPALPASYLLRMLAMVALVLALVAGLHVYIATRLIDGFGWTGNAAVAGWVAISVLFISLPLGLAASRLLPKTIGAAFTWVAYLWMGAFGLMLTSVLVTDVLRWAVTSGYPSLAAPAGVAQAWAMVAVTVPGVALGLYRARNPVVERQTVAVKQLAEGLNGLKLVQLTDVHIGETLDRAFLASVVAKVNALNPDVVVITGDLVDAPVAALQGELDPLKDVVAPLGRYYVTGNHEYYHGGRAWELELARLGWTVLRNEHRILERGGARLAIAGIPDLEARRLDPHHRPDVTKALAGVPSEVPRVLLAHQPRASALVGDERVDLQLSGHTHGGQIFPFMFFVRLQQPVVAGLHQLGKVRVYTSRGTGYWGPPVRIGAPPEITELILISAAA